MKQILTLALVGLILVFSAEAQAKKAGFEGEVGEENESGAFLGAGGVPSASTQRIEMDKSRLESVDEKIDRAEQEGNRPASEGTKSESASPASSVDPKGARP